MKIYVGRWDMLPAEWEGYNGLSEKSEDEIKAEVTREIDAWEDIYHNPYNNFMGFYSPKDFEDTFNSDINNVFRPDTYWIKIF